MNILRVLTEKRELGNVGENAVADLLKKNGYKITKKNYVANGHEVDIIAENKEYICFVEVKTRTEGAKNPYDMLPKEAVDLKKQQSIIKAARVYSASVGGKKKFRFDVAEVYLNQKRKVEKINYIENAFTLQTYR